MAYLGYGWCDKSCTYQAALDRELSMMQNCNREKLDAYTRMAMNSQNAFNPLQTCKEEAERYFMEKPINIMMSKDSGCPLNAVWEMAIYCDTTLRQDWKEKWEKEAERWMPLPEEPKEGN